ncbi:MAG: outer membrane lipid asymmetry maintenance protein MlaD [Alphaproteobacteria bacterium]|nr:outer membrane lipid asymmetry maintenance protein MlaD [Alphaproteobacteria bacterium]
MQRNVVETVLGAVVIAVAAGFLFFFYSATDIRPANGYEISASFSKIDGLDTGSTVRVSGVKVGKVTDFRLDPESYTAIVTMNIDNGVKLPLDTAAVIASGGLLDGKFLSLEPGADTEMMEPGDRIQFTQSTPGLEQLLGQVIFSMNKKGDDTTGPAE